MNVKSLLGILMIALGVLFILSLMQVIYFENVFSTWWPLAVMLLGLFIIAKHRRSVFSGMLVFAVGAIFQARNLDIIPHGEFWSIFGPTLLILFGIKILLPSKSCKEKKSIKSNVKINDTDFEINTIFGNEVHRLTSDVTTGEANTIFSQAVIDMSNAQLTNNSASLEINTIFGETKLIVPEGWDLKLSGSPVFGSIENKTRNIFSADSNSPRLYIDATVVFGALKIRN
ncbi:MAG: hypothetical protein HW421_2419 [Ignavibacteria bacterium]|nr:hypothetical protein [Ignavibacteria bacterium]